MSTTTATPTVRRPARALVTLAVAAALALAAAFPAQAQQIKNPELPEPRFVSLKTQAACDEHLGPGIEYSLTLVNPPQGGALVEKLAWRPKGGATTHVDGNAGYLQTGEGVFELKGKVTHIEGLFENVTVYESKWIEVTVACSDEPDPDPDPDPGPDPDPDQDPDDGGNGGDGGGNSGDPQVLDDIVQASPNFTG